MPNLYFDVDFGNLASKLLFQLGYGLVGPLIQSCLRAGCKFNEWGDEEGYVLDLLLLWISLLLF
jgi:hypothetical protein